MFKLDGDAPVRRELAIRFKEAIEALPFQIPELVDAVVNINENADEQWDMVLTARVNTWPELPVYAAHPAHLAAVAIIKPALAGRACVDFQDR